MIMILYKDHHQHASSPLLLLLFLILMIMIMIIMIIMIIITIIIIIMNMIISPNITFRNNVQACNTDSVVWFACDNPGLRMAHRKGSESRPHRPARGTQASRSGNLWNFPVGNVQKLGSMGIMILKNQLAFGLPLLLGYGSGNVKMAWTTKRTMTYNDHATTHNLWFERVQVFGTQANGSNWPDMFTRR